MLRSIMTTSNAVLLLAILAATTTLATPIEANTTAVIDGVDLVAQDPGHELGARGITGKLYCGNFANANGHMAVSLVSALGNSLKGHSYPVAAHGCNRVNCWDTSGVYVCNDNSHSITVTGQQVHDAAKIINNECCAYSATGGQNYGSIMAGQQFTQTNWNVVIGYANCNHPITQRPSDIGGWGVNAGSCKSWVTTVTNG